LLDCFTSLGLTQFVNISTRYSTTGNGNILDIILSNDHLFVDIVDSHPPLSTSDHAMVEFTLYFQVTQPPATDFSSVSLLVYDWSRAEYDANLTLIWAHEVEVGNRDSGQAAVKSRTKDFEDMIMNLL
jgi:hypothetical protein